MAIDRGRLLSTEELAGMGEPTGAISSRKPAFRHEAPQDTPRACSRSASDEHDEYGSITEEMRQPEQDDGEADGQAGGRVDRRSRPAVYGPAKAPTVRDGWGSSFRCCARPWIAWTSRRGGATS